MDTDCLFDIEVLPCSELQLGFLVRENIFLISNISAMSTTALQWLNIMYAIDYLFISLIFLYI